MEYQPPIKAKGITFNKTFIVDGSDSEEYGEWVKKTAQLIERPYMTVHRICTREKWSLDEIKRTYQNSTKHNGNCKPVICWWASRKRRNTV